MDHQRVCVRTLEDGVRAAGEMVGAAGVGEREAVDHGVVVLVLLAGQYRQLGEAVVHPHLAGAGDVRQHAVEHPAAVGVGVEALVDEVADAAPGLRTAPGIGLLDPRTRSEEHTSELQSLMRTSYA